MGHSLDEVEVIVEELVVSGQPNLNNDKIKKLKHICKHSNTALQHVFSLLMTHLEKHHSEIRYSTFQIIAQLFDRSHAFRQLVLEDCQVYMDLTMDLDFQNPLPPPKHVAEKLKNEALKLMCTWFKKFGPAYSQLRVAYQFLKTVKKIKFDSENPQSQLTFLVNEEREGRQRKFNKKRIDKLLKEVDTDFLEIKNCTKEINNCFKLLVPNLTETVEKVSSSSNAISNNINTEEQRETGVLSPGYNLNLNLSDVSSIKILPNSDNKALIKHLIDSVKVAKKVHLQCLKSWLSSACKYGGSASLIRRLSDAKLDLSKCLEKYDDLEISLEEEDEDCNDFEIVNDGESSVPGCNQTPIEQNNVMHEFASTSKASTSAVHDVKKTQHVSELDQGSSLERVPDCNNWKPMQSSINDPTSYSYAIKQLHEKKHKNIITSDLSTLSRVIPNSTKVKLKKILPSDLKRKMETSKLKSVAPVVSFGTDLLQWDQGKLKELKETMTLGSAKEFGISHRFYGESSSASTEGVSDTAIGHLTSRTIEFSGKFERVTHICRAPLPNGKLCPRQDRYKCPFHGNIIERDAVGNPRNPYDLNKCVPKKNNSKEDESYLKDLEMNLGGSIQLTKRRKKMKPENGLTDLKAPKNNSRSRLYKKINKGLKRVHAAMDKIDDRRNLDKFGNNFNYALK